MSGADDNLRPADLRADGFVQRAFRGPDDPTYVRVMWTFVLASVTHLWLADAAHPDWHVANAIYAIGLIVLVTTRGAAGWLLCAMGLLGPLLFARDQLTQSMLLLMVCGAASVATLTRPFATGAFVQAVRGLLVATYAFAAFHKLNADFFDPHLGCATYGMRELAVYFQLPQSTFDGWAVWHAPLAVGTELAIAALYAFRFCRAGRAVSALFHIPLTLTMAPAFVFVMAVGHVAYLDEDDIVRYRTLIRTHGLTVAAGAVALTALSLWAHGALPELTMIPREAALYFVTIVVIVDLFSPGVVRPRRKPRERLATVTVGLFTLNCLTPYTGIQYQHTAAMLSNLRIDEGCWNHYVMPEVLRVTDDYLRIDHVAFGTDGAIPDLQDSVKKQLWSPPQLRQMRRNWCRPEVRPFSLGGTYRDRSWSIHDLCDVEEPWPFNDDGILGLTIFPDYLRYQKNLQRACPQACIH